MRISSSLLSKIGLETMLSQQKKLSDTQIQVSTGNRILAPSDDPYGSARTLDLKESLSLNEQYKYNTAQVENRLGLQEGVLDGVETAIQRVRELTLTGNNGSQNPETRRLIRSEVDQLLKQVVALSNTADANGEYVFSGYQGNTKPFDADGAGGFNYYGDDGQRFIKVGTDTRIAMGDSGEATFLDIKNGNGKFQTKDNPNNQGGGIIDPGTVSGTYIAGNYRIAFLPSTTGNERDPVEYYVLDGENKIIEPSTEVGMAEADFIAGGFAGIAYEDGAAIRGLDDLGMNLTISGTPTAESGPPLRQDSFTISPSNNQSLFSTIQNVIDSLGMQQLGTADLSEFHNSMNRNIVDLDQSLEKILEIRASVGARLNTLDKQVEINETFNVQLNTTLSEIQDLDYSEAVTRLNLQLVGLQAAQNAYSKVQGLSLFNYL